jgi:radical SAM superfamily enzyme YgiQ (UPF0313 family)
MKIHFVFPPVIKTPKYGELNIGCLPPLGILYLASYIRGKIGGIEMKATDGLLTGYKQTIANIESFKPDILAVSFYTANALSAFELINYFKYKYPYMFILAGGPHATALPEESLQRSNVDVVVIGEGEITFYELVNLYRKGLHHTAENLSKVNGIAFRDNGYINKTAPCEPIEDVDTIPFPARDLIDITRYKGWYLNRNAPETGVLFSRGCSHECTFCANVVWKVCKRLNRRRSPKNIVDEIKCLHREYGIREIYDCSDEFNSHLGHALEVCQEIKNRDLDITWKTSMRAAPLTEELAKAMAESSCWYVMMGIETGNPETMKGIKKHMSFTQIENACRLLRKYHIKVMGLFMLYNVWEENGKLRYETTEMVKNTFRYINHLVKLGLLDYIGWSITVPYPGSQLYDTAVKYNLIKEKYAGNWDQWLVGDSYILQLPGVNHKDQVRLKTIGQLARARLIIKKHDFKMKDIGWMIKKSFKLVQNELQFLVPLMKK